MTEDSQPENVHGNAEATGKLLGGITGKGFMPGQSGNPAGRSKKKPQTEIYEELLQEPEFREAYKQAVKARLLSGRMVGHLEGRELADRIEGKVTQKIDAELNVGLSARVKKALELISDE